MAKQIKRLSIGSDAWESFAENELHKLVSDVIERLKESTRDGSRGERYGESEIADEIENALMNPPWDRFDFDDVCQVEWEVEERVRSALGKARMRPPNASERQQRQEAKQAVARISRRLKAFRKARKASVK